MAQAHRGGKLNHKINMYIMGDFFSGKTTLGLQLAKLHDENGEPIRLLVIDCESNGVSFALDELEEDGVDLNNVYTVWTQSLAEVTHYIEQVANGKPLHELGPDGEELDEYVLDAQGRPFVPTAIFLDGATILKMTCQQSLLNLSRKRARVRATRDGLTGEAKAVAIDGAGLEYKDYNSLNFSGQELILDLTGSNVHWIISAREKKETKSVKVGGQIQSVETGKIVSDAFKGAEFNASTVVRLYRDEDEPDTVKMQVLKDRSKTWAVGQIVENPSILDMQSMIDKHGGKDIVIKNTMDQAVETEMKIYQEKAGITDTSEEESESSSSSTPDIETLRKEVKKYHSKMNPEQRKQFSDRIKSENIPTSLSKIEDPNMMSRVVVIAKEIVEA